MAWARGRPSFRFRWLTGVCLAGALLAGSGPAWPAPPPPQPAPELKITLKSDEATEACLARRSCVQRAFLQATIGDAKDRTGQLVKWGGPVRVGVLSSARLAKDGQVVTERALNLIGILSRQAGADLRSARGDTGAAINLILFISDDFKRDRDGRFAPIIAQVFKGNREVYDSILAADSGPVCRGQWFVDQKLSANGAIAMIESDLPLPEFERCIYSNMLKVLGLANDLDGDLDSVMNDAANRTSWTALDFVLLQILYHPRIKAGMTQQQILAVFPEVYADVMKALS